MKKRYKLTDLNCAHCAGQMEDAIRKLDGVEEVSVNILTQKFTLKADDARFDDILNQAVAICKKVEPDCEIHI